MGGEAEGRRTDTMNENTGTLTQARFARHSRLAPTLAQTRQGRQVQGQRRNAELHVARIPKQAEEGQARHSPRLLWAGSHDLRHVHLSVPLQQIRKLQHSDRGALERDQRRRRRYEGTEQNRAGNNNTQRFKSNSNLQNPNPSQKMTIRKRTSTTTRATGPAQGGPAQ